MKPLVALLALALAVPATAQGDGPYKLVITYYQSIVVVDYPNLARCERAMRAVNARMSAKAAAEGLPAESGEVAFCIPG